MRANASHHPPNDIEKGQKTWEPALHKKGSSTSGNLGKWIMKEDG